MGKYLNNFILLYKFRGFQGNLFSSELTTFLLYFRSPAKEHICLHIVLGCSESMFATGASHILKTKRETKSHRQKHASGSPFAYDSEDPKNRNAQVVSKALKVWYDYQFTLVITSLQVSYCSHKDREDTIYRYCLWSSLVFGADTTEMSCPEATRTSIKSMPSIPVRNRQPSDKILFQCSKTSTLWSSLVSDS